MLTLIANIYGISLNSIHPANPDKV